MGSAIQAYRSDEKGREEQRYNSAWVVVNSPGQPSVDGGRREALQYLKNSSHRSLQGAELSNALLSYIDLNGADLNRSNMRNTDLFGADLRAVSLWSGHMEEVSFQFTQLKGIDLEDAHLECADLRGAHLDRLDVKEYLNSICLNKANIEDIEGKVQNIYVTSPIRNGEIRPLVPTNLEGAHLEFAHLEGANLGYARLVGANLTHAHLEKYKDKFDNKSDPDTNVTYKDDLHRAGDNNYVNSSHDKPPDRYVPCMNTSGGLKGLYRDKPENWEPPISDICGWFSEHKPLGKGGLDHDDCGKPKDQTTASFCPQAPLVTNLMGADLRGAILKGADLRGAILTDACLKGADLRGAILDADQIDDTVYLCETKLPDHITEKISGSRNCSDPAPQHCSEPTSSTQGHD